MGIKQRDEHLNSGCHMLELCNNPLPQRLEEVEGCLRPVDGADDDESV